MARCAILWWVTCPKRPLRRSSARSSHNRIQRGVTKPSFGWVFYWAKYGFSLLVSREGKISLLVLIESKYLVPRLAALARDDKPTRDDSLITDNCSQYFRSTPTTRPCTWTEAAGTMMGAILALAGCRRMLSPSL